MPQRPTTIRVSPIKLLALLAASDADVSFSVSAHRVPRELFDAIDGEERHVPAEKNGMREYWTKVIYTRGSSVYLYCSEPSPEEAA